MAHSITPPVNPTAAKGLAVSNIAWPAGDEARDEAIRILLDGGATGVEVAPSLLFADPATASTQEIHAARASFQAAGLPVVAMQALLFNRPQLKLFGSPAQRESLLQHLHTMAQLAASLGATVLVFGSPKNRLKDTLTQQQAAQIAIPFFQELGNRAHKLGVVFGVEANPTDYGCDWLTTLDDAAQFVTQVASPAIALHGDAGGMIMTNQAPPQSLHMLAHHHASEPNLDPLTTRPEHNAIAHWLAQSGHKGWISIEMRRPENNWQMALKQALAAALAVYAPALGHPTT
jgi:sugar phosphate isomerase/epimerase